MAARDQGFDSITFFKALEATTLARGVNWKEVSLQTGVGASTLSRMAQGRGPDAASLAILSAWAGLNPADFTVAMQRAQKPEPLAEITARLRNDPRLTSSAVDVLQQVIKATYQSLTEK